jgi:hypothetical protein
MTKSTKKLLIMKLAARVWPPSICSRGGALLAYLVLKRGGCSDFKIKRVNRGVETIEGGQQKEGSTSKATPEHQKRVEVKVRSHGRCFAIALRKMKQLMFCH